MLLRCDSHVHYMQVTCTSHAENSYSDVNHMCILEINIRIACGILIITRKLHVTYVKITCTSHAKNSYSDVIHMCIVKFKCTSHATISDAKL